MLEVRRFEGTFAVADVEEKQAQTQGNCRVVQYAVQKVVPSYKYC